ncbi:MAG: FAD-binding oxidoreductase [Enterobacteriaceae bacterium PSpyr]|nr:MAG: FAD-binding oxidoreductase [Enterobacteriaceae bacterium PSpyr]
MVNWVIGKVLNIKKYPNNLFKIFIKASINKFISGQFTKISMKIKKKYIQRAYSFVNSSENSILEFYILFIPNGKFSYQLLNLTVNKEINISKNSFGFFILDEIPKCKTLWMICTNTGIGPYLSILNENRNLERFKNLILIYINKFLINCNYNFEIKNLRNNYYGKLYILNIISQEKIYGTLNGRIGKFIMNGFLEKNIGLSLNYKNSHVMICGNPFMIKDIKNILIKFRNMKKHLHFKKGNITIERYW